MLTACIECKGEVSDTASVCPHCGHPIPTTAGVIRAAGVPLANIQATSKTLKVQEFFAILLIVFGLIAAMTGEASTVHAWALIVGIVWFLIVRFLTWWHHD